MGLLHMGQTLRISSHFTRHLSSRQGEKRKDESIMYQLSIDSSAVLHYTVATSQDDRLKMQKQQTVTSVP